LFVNIYVISRDWFIRGIAPTGQLEIYISSRIFPCSSVLCLQYTRDRRQMGMVVGHIERHSARAWHGDAGHAWVTAAAIEKVREIAIGFNPRGFTHETARVGWAHAHHPPAHSGKPWQAQNTVLPIVEPTQHTRALQALYPLRERKSHS
jgi:hypothetical protein